MNNLAALSLLACLLGIITLHRSFVQSTSTPNRTSSKTRRRDTRKGKP